MHTPGRKCHHENRKLASELAINIIGKRQRARKNLSSDVQN
jgi:hypothetical protein